MPALKLGCKRTQIVWKTKSLSRDRIPFLDIALELLQWRLVRGNVIKTILTWFAFEKTPPHEYQVQATSLVISYDETRQFPRSLPFPTPAKCLQNTLNGHMNAFCQFPILKGKESLDSSAQVVMVEIQNICFNYRWQGLSNTRKPNMAYS